jgi:hypothetical protein
VADPASTAYDTVIRMLGEDLTTRMGQPPIIEKKTGGSGLIGADLVTKATPYGYTPGMPAAIKPSCRRSASARNNQHRGVYNLSFHGAVGAGIFFHQAPYERSQPRFRC